jgi:NAD(P)-dependent dehydrogenase (short-subunit alcohol dehydrogenase family)
MEAFSLKGKRAVITGGGSGIGFGIAQVFIEAGAHVILIGQNEQKLIDAKKQLGNQCEYVQFDVTNLELIPELVLNIQQEFGGVDTLVNCAGIHLKKDALETTDQEFLAVLNVHLLSVFALTREFAKGMIDRKDGSIILISSMAAVMGLPKVVAYATGKSAILGMMKSMVAELAIHGIRINAIAPGWIETPMLHQALDSDPPRKTKVLGRIPVEEFGMPSDIGFSALYLASRAGRYVNGVLLPVDGGAAIGF